MVMIYPSISCAMLPGPLIKKKKVVQELALFPFGVISYTDIKAIKHILCATAKP